MQKIRNPLRSITAERVVHPVAQRVPFSFTESQRLWKEAHNYIPGGSQNTRRDLYPEWPDYFARAKGCRMWDVDDNEFIDFLCSIGPIVLGYAYDKVDDAVVEIIRSSFQSSTNHPVQVKLAKLLVNVIPCAQQARFFKTGTEATMAAVSLARHITGRTAVAQCGYHGWTDMWRRGTTKGVHTAAWEVVHPFSGATESLEHLLNNSDEDFAAVIICPIDTRPFTQENYQEIIDIAHKHGALVIFDEIKSGFRTALGGAQELLGVVPDLTTLSKGMGNGYPISAVVGMSDYMEHMVHTPAIGTFSVEAIGLTAAMATIRELQAQNAVSHMWKVGQQFIDGLNTICNDHHMDDMSAVADPVPSIFRFAWHSKLANNYNESIPKYFFGECLKYGLFLSPWHVGFVNYSHSSRDIDEALDICDYVMARTKKQF